MKKNKHLFWNVDTQIDFMEPQGKLYVPGAETIKPVLKKITAYARKNRIRVVNTADWHFKDSKEFSVNPDFINSFPPHCMAYSQGADYVEESKPYSPYTVIEWNQKFMTSDFKKLKKAQNILIRKDAFDVFAGNPYTEDILKILSPEKIYVYGVATNVCVHCAVSGLVERGFKVTVFDDAIKELPKIDTPFTLWKKWGVKRLIFEEWMLD